MYRLFWWRFCTFRSSCWSDRSCVCFCLDYNIGSLPIRNLLLSWCPVKFNWAYFFSGTPELCPITGFQFDQFLHRCSIFDVVIGCIRSPYNGGVAAFSHIAPNNSHSFQEGNIPLVFNLNYFFFFLSKQHKFLRKLDDLVGSLHIEFLSCNLLLHGRGSFSPHLARVCRLLHASLWCPIFLTFEAPQRSRNVQLNSLKTIADLHLVRVRILLNVRI